MVMAMSMTANSSRRQMLLALLALPLADVRVLARQTKAGAPAPPAVGNLIVPLDQWHTLTFRHGGDTVTFTTGDIFRILKGGDRE